MAKDKASGKRAERAESAAAPTSKKARASMSSAHSGSGSKGKKGKGRDDSAVASAAAINSDAVAGASGKSKVTLQAPKSGIFDVGPILVSASDFAPPEDTDFRLHHIPYSAGPSDEARASTSNISMEHGMILAGETESMDIVASNWDLTASFASDANARREAKGYAGEYFIGVYDPAFETVTLRQAPLFTLRRSVKALNSLSIGTQSSFSDWSERVQARRGLGEAFGNRKTKAKARNEDRMKVDTSNMADVMDTLRSNIDETMNGLPTADAIEQQADLARPIPPPNLKALTPQEAYPIHVLIPDTVLRMLQTRSLETTESSDELGKFVPAPAANASWIKERMWALVQASQLRKGNAASATSPSKKIDFSEDGAIMGPSPAPGSGADSGASVATSSILKTSKEDSRLKLKIVLYISLLWGFAKFAGGRGNGGDKEVLLGKLRLNRMSGGELILDDLFTRFAQAQRGAKRAQLTSFTETKLYAYMFALSLHLDDFSLDPVPLARDLAMGPQRVAEVFKSLGCSTTTAPRQGAVAGGGGGGDGQRVQRRVILKCPVELPKVRQVRRG